MRNTTPQNLTTNDYIALEAVGKATLTRIDTGGMIIFTGFNWDGSPNTTTVTFSPTDLDNADSEDNYTIGSAQARITNRAKLRTDYNVLPPLPTPPPVENPPVNNSGN